jgi:phenylpyruvate tautomerase PptA (4-oxalocrotonate tautomerase family)
VRTGNLQQGISHRRGSPVFKFTKLKSDALVVSDSIMELLASHPAIIESVIEEVRAEFWMGIETGDAEALRTRVIEYHSMEKLLTRLQSEAGRRFTTQETDYNA